MADASLVNAVLDSIVGHESGGKNIQTNLKGSAGRATAQGYFQYTNGTWRSAARQAGVDTSKYPTAMTAPYEVQRQVAFRDVSRILDANGGDVRAVPRVWYTGGNTLGKAADNIVPRPEYGNTQTPAQYSAGWLKRLERSLKGENVITGGVSYANGGAVGKTAGGAAVDSILATSRRPINFPAPLPASVLNPTSEVPMPTLAERMAQARGVYSAPKIGTGAEAIAQLTARKVQSLNQNIAGLDKAVEQARARLLSQGDYAAGRIQAIRARMDPRFAASGAQQAAFGNASAGAIGGIQGALGAGAAADGTGTADLGQAFGENLAATGQLAALDNTFAGAVRGNTNSFLSELAGPGTDAITQAGLGSLELNNLEAGTTLRQRSTDALDKETSDITRLYEEARINAELNRPQQEMAALAAINDFYNNQERFGIDRQQLALTQRGQDIGVQQFGVTSGLDARRIANDERSTTANIQQNAAQIGISARNAATSEGQLRLAEREREDKVTESKTKTELVKLQNDPMALGYVPYNKGEKDRYPLMPSVAGDIWKLNRDGIDFVSALPPEGRTFTAQKALDASKSLDNAVLHPETLAGWASVQDVTTEGQVKAEAQKYYREVALSQMPGSYKGDPTATKNFVKQFTDTNVEETVKYWRLATASSLTGSEKQPVSFSANEKAYINKYLSEMSADRSIQQNVAGGLSGLTAAGGLATAGAKNAKINPSLPISPAVRAAVRGVRGPRV